MKGVSAVKSSKWDIAFASIAPVFSGAFKILEHEVVICSHCEGQGNTGRNTMNFPHIPREVPRPALFIDAARKMSKLGGNKTGVARARSLASASPLVQEYLHQAEKCYAPEGLSLKSYGIGHAEKTGWRGWGKGLVAGEKTGGVG